VLSSVRVAALVALRIVAATILALLAAVNTFGFFFLAYAWFTDTEITIRGGFLTPVLSAIVLVLCVRGANALLRQPAPSR